MMGTKKNHLEPAWRDYCKELLLINRDGDVPDLYKFKPPMTLQSCAEIVANGYVDGRCTVGNVEGVIRRELGLKLWKAPKPIKPAEPIFSEEVMKDAFYKTLQQRLVYLENSNRDLREDMDRVIANGLGGRVNKIEEVMRQMAKVAWPGPGKSPWAPPS